MHFRMHFKIGPYYYVILRYSLLSWLLAKIRFFWVNKWTIWKNYSQILSIVNHPCPTEFIYFNFSCVPFWGSGLDSNLGHFCSSLTGLVAACVGIIWDDSVNSKSPPSQRHGTACCVYQAALVKSELASSWCSCCIPGFCVGLPMPVVIYRH